MEIKHTTPPCNYKNIIKLKSTLRLRSYNKYKLHHSSRIQNESDRDLGGFTRRTLCGTRHNRGITSRGGHAHVTFIVRHRAGTRTLGAGGARRLL